METQRDTVVVLSGTGANDAINGLMTSLSQLIQMNGLKVEYFDLSCFSLQESSRFFIIISSEKIKFCLTYLGIGQELQVETTESGNQNVWEFFNIPLLKLHGDIPAYFLERHLDKPFNSINLYPCEEFLAFHKTVIPDSTCISTICDPWLISDVPEHEIDFHLREKGRLYYIKNGGDPFELQALWKSSLHPELGKQLRALSHEVLALGLAPGTLNLHEVVTGYLVDQKIDIRHDGKLLSFYVAQIDDYLRRVKSTMIAKALLSCPVVIQGSRWEHLDTTGAIATLMPAQNFDTTEELYKTQLGIIDMSPNVNTSCHDRMMRAAGTYSFALTNQSSWLNNLLPAMNDAAFCFHPDHIRGAVNDALKDPARCVELGREYGRAFRERYLPHEFVAKLSTVAEMTRLRHATPKPRLQPYMIW